MPTNLKKLIRARRAKTGESYQAALRHIRAKETRAPEPRIGLERVEGEREPPLDPERNPTISRIPGARIPTWLRYKLAEAATASSQNEGYGNAGYHLGRYHLDDFCEVPEVVDAVSEDEVHTDPTGVLRRVFANSEHPQGELTDVIPDEWRKAFLIGLLAGAAEEDPGDAWLSLLS